LCRPSFCPLQRVGVPRCLGVVCCRHMWGIRFPLCSEVVCPGVMGVCVRFVLGGSPHYVWRGLERCGVFPVDTLTFWQPLCSLCCDLLLHSSFKVPAKEQSFVSFNSRVRCSVAACLPCNTPYINLTTAARLPCNTLLLLQSHHRVPNVCVCVCVCVRVCASFL
jgi:hypothetical protein